MVRPDSKKKVGADGGAGAGAGSAEVLRVLVLRVLVLMAVLLAVLVLRVGAESGTSQENVEDNKGDFTFIPSETFEGERKGYTFKKGDKGTGYYPDTRS